MTYYLKRYQKKNLKKEAIVKTKCILGVVLGIFILFFAGCATTSYNSSAPKPIKSIWPSLDRKSKDKDSSSSLC